MIGMNATTGQAIGGIEHIRQSLRDILTTPIGSRVMRREYGSEVPELIDQPLNDATRLRIFAATAYAVMLWEQRINLTSLQLERNDSGTAILIMSGIAEQQNVQIALAVSQGGTA